MVPNGALKSVGDGAYSNWNGVVRFCPKQLIAPKELAELQEIIEQSSRVRLIGSGHPMNGAVAAEFGHSPDLNEQYQPDGKAQARHGRQLERVGGSWRDLGRYRGSVVPRRASVLFLAAISKNHPRGHDRQRGSRQLLSRVRCGGRAGYRIRGDYQLG